jgi:DHA1 family bicyclomycin/chloramphenicol resistance-like MFS transporter
MQSLLKDNISFTMIRTLLTSVAVSITTIVPTASQYFNASTTSTISILLLGAFFGKMLSLALSRRIDSKKMLCVLLFIGLIGSITASFSFSVAQFFIGMFFLGMGVYGATAPLQTAIQTTFKEKAAHQLSFYTALSMLLTPLIIIMISLFAHHGHWKMGLLGLASIILCTLVLTYLSSLMPVHQSSKMNLEWTSSLKHLISIDYIRHALPATLIISSWYLFFGVAPFLFVDQLHMSVKHYGYLLVVIYLSAGTGLHIAAYLDQRLPKITQAYIGYGIAFLSSLLMILLTHIGLIVSWEIALPLVFYQIGVYTSLPASTYSVTENIPQFAAIIIAIFWIQATLAAAFSSHIGATSLSQYLGETLSIMSFLALFFTWALNRLYLKTKLSITK